MNNKVGILLSGGLNKRLRPASLAVSKQNLPLYNKPLIYYSLCSLLISGIREILLISTEIDLPVFERLLGDGSDLGIEISYKIQKEPKGISEAFLLGEDFIDDKGCCLVLGDNVFYSHELTNIFTKINNKTIGANILGFNVSNPQNYGVLQLDNKNKILKIVEKPQTFVSNIAIPGFYSCDNSVIEKAKQIKPSKRGELEIVDILNLYLQESKLDLELLGRGTLWADCGTPDSLLETANFIATLEKRQGLMIGSPHEISYKNKWINKSQLSNIIDQMGHNNDYGKYLEGLLKDE